jgi:hypothetical protein
VNVVEYKLTVHLVIGVLALVLDLCFFKEIVHLLEALLLVGKLLNAQHFRALVITAVQVLIVVHQIHLLGTLGVRVPMFLAVAVSIRELANMLLLPKHSLATAERVGK